ncbi:MAG: class I SAM-dependent methyltransferase [Parachlamydiales bacterium]|nr:class I SAM-dependent methyltransferase [Parachlamydiales bacterium]
MTKHAYLLIDSGEGKKLEQWGKYRIIRPAAQALWTCQKEKKFWTQADAQFSREDKGGWTYHTSLPSTWNITWGGIEYAVFCSDFGHMGVFPEHLSVWNRLQQKVRKGQNILNLFAYTGGATLVAAQKGASVCHLDASHPMVQKARENAKINGLDNFPIRWIVDDVFKFLKREIRRGVRYDGIILDPPTFGRGKRQEVFKLERDIEELLQLVSQLLAFEKDNFVIFTSHTPGFTPLVIDHLLQEHFGKEEGKIHTGELIIAAQDSFTLPSGSFGIWER